LGEVAHLLGIADEAAIEVVTLVAAALPVVASSPSQEVVAAPAMTAL
jgi:hypothetical protein